MSNPAVIVLISSDLMFSTAVAGAAAASGAKLHVATSLEETAKLAEREPLALVIVDLATLGCDVADVTARLRAAPQPPAIVAYGPHVHAEKLTAARKAGCDEVLTRGQFHSQMREVMARYVGARDGC